MITTLLIGFIGVVIIPAFFTLFGPLLFMIFVFPGGALAGVGAAVVALLNWLGVIDVSGWVGAILGWLGEYLPFLAQ